MNHKTPHFCHSLSSTCATAGSYKIWYFSHSQTPNQSSFWNWECMAQFLHSFPSMALPFSFARIICLSQVEVSGPSSCFSLLCSYFYQLLKNLTENIWGLSKQTEYSSAWRKVGKLSNTHCPSDIYAILGGAPFQTWNGKGENCYIKLHLKTNFKKLVQRLFWLCIKTL